MAAEIAHGTLEAEIMTVALLRYTPTCGRVHEIRYGVFMLACWAVTIRIAHVFVGNADIAIGDTINSNGKLVETAGHGDGEVLWHKSCGLSKHRG